MFQLKKFFMLTVLIFFSMNPTSFAWETITERSLSFYLNWQPSPDEVDFEFCREEIVRQVMEDRFVASWSRLEGEARAKVESRIKGYRAICEAGRWYDQYGSPGYLYGESLVACELVTDVIVSETNAFSPACTIRSVCEAHVECIIP